MLISYFIILGTILALLFVAMPMSLRAQTNELPPANLEVTMATNALAAHTNLLQTNPPVQINDSDVHAASTNPVNGGFPRERLPGLGLGTTVASVMPFIFIIAVLIIIFYFKHRRNQLAHETLRLMVEKGVPVTPELVASLKADERQNRKTGYLLTGLILLGIGIGVMMVAGKPGLIILFIGVAFLIVWLVRRMDKNSNQPPKP